jgi:hypothetical protein
MRLRGDGLRRFIDTVLPWYDPAAEQAKDEQAERIARDSERARQLTTELLRTKQYLGQRGHRW